jgi:predicted permease
MYCPRLFCFFLFASLFSNVVVLASLASGAILRLIRYLRLPFSSADCRRVPDSAFAGDMPHA